MKVERTALISALKIASLAVETRNVIPILGTIAIRSRGEALHLTGYDLDTEVTARIPITDGAANAAHADLGCLPAARSIIAALALGDAEAEISRAQMDKETSLMAIRSGALDMQVKDLPVEDFPQLACGADTTSIAISTDHLAAILRAAGAMSIEETRYYLNGIYIHTSDEPSTVSPKSIMAVATDGHRLYRSRLAIAGAEDLDKALPFNANPGGQRGIIIPKSVIKILRALAGEIRGDITLAIMPITPRNRDDNLAPAPNVRPAAALRFTTKQGIEVEIRTKLIDGTFPDYSRVIPQDEQDKRILVSRADLQRAVRGISALSSRGSKPVKLTFDPEGGRLRVSAETVDEIRAGSTWIPAETNVTTPFSIGFNGGYLDDLCAASKGDTLIMATQDQGAPTLITSPEQGDFLTVLMPMRV